MTTITTITLVKEEQILKELFPNIETLKDEYPEFEKWYFEQVIPDVNSGKRQVYAVDQDGRYAGILIIKNSDEKKICTLRVQPEYQGMGIGTQLMNLAIKKLSSTKPLITVSDTHLNEYTSLFSTFGFAFSEIHLNKYKAGHSEFVFNGHLG